MNLLLLYKIYYFIKFEFYIIVIIERYIVEQLKNKGELYFKKNLV